MNQLSSLCLLAIKETEKYNFIFVLYAPSTISDQMGEAELPSSVLDRLQYKVLFLQFVEEISCGGLQRCFPMQSLIQNGV